jgi:hypothetical protein
MEFKKKPKHLSQLNNDSKKQSPGKKKTLLNENEGTRYQNLWYATKAVFRGKLTNVNFYVKKRSSMNNLAL